MPLACACWHTCHMVLGVRLSKDDAPRTGWDTKPPAASSTFRTERPHLVPFPSQRHGEQAGTQLRQIQTRRCTQRRPRACAPEWHRHRRSHRLGYALTRTPYARPKETGKKSALGRVHADLGRGLRPLGSLSVVLKLEQLTTSLQMDETEKLGEKGDWKWGKGKKKQRSERETHG